MKFSVGQKVVFLHEEGGGEIVGFEKGVYYVEDADGFKRKYREHELALVHSEDFYVESGANEKLENKTHSNRIEISSDEWEIDLHIEELIDSHRGMTNHEIVQKQMIEFQKFVRTARNKKIRRLVVIHGIGVGVLRSEVRAYLDGISGVEYFDEDYRQGATVVLMRYKH